MVLLPGKVKFCKFNDVSHLKKLVNKKTVAIIIEFVQGDGGINICSKNFAKAVKEICKSKKILLIGDEIQGGIGRTGKIFAYKHYGVNPDIITSAKGLGSGIPIGATIVKKYISKIISTGFHGSTFGGGMLQTRVSYNVFNAINTKSFLNKVIINGKYLSNLLKKIHIDHKDKIIDTRCLGLMAAIEFKTNEIASKTYNKISKNGLITTLIQGNIIRITPPLIINKKQLKKGLDIISKIL